MQLSLNSGETWTTTVVCLLQVAANETCRNYKCGLVFPEQCTYTSESACTGSSSRNTWAASFWWVILLACIGGLVLLCCIGCGVSKFVGSQN